MEPNTQAATNVIQAIGFAAGALTTISFVPQVIRTWRCGREGLSIPMLFIFGGGVTLWLVYGVLTGSTPMVVANALTGAQVIAIAVLSRRRK